MFNALVVDGIALLSDRESCRSHEVVQVLREVAPRCDEDLEDLGWGGKKNKPTPAFDGKVQEHA